MQPPDPLSLTQRPWLAAKVAWCPEAEDSSGRRWTRALLASRGLATSAEQAAYLTPELGAIADPNRMADMDRATERLAAALAADEPICIYGDYDVDGVCSAAIVAEALRGLGGSRVDVFIPQRRQDGYGLNAARVAEIAGHARLLVAVDCGVTACQEVQVARDLGCDVIIVDHHQVPDQLPPAVAVLDPLRRDCAYPFKGLCAAGVAFLMVVALRRRLRDAGAFRGRAELDVRPLLDLVALATVADMVPMQATNRALVAAGLRRLRSWPRPGLRALAEAAGVDLAAATTSDLGFRLGPRVNARGRMHDAQLAVDLMVVRDDGAARAMAACLEQANQERREVERLTLAAARAQVERAGWSRDAALVVADPGWHAGVLGLVASRLAQLYNAPTIAIGEQGRGSVRSAAGLDVHRALGAARAHLQRWGGHRAAAGCQVAWEQVPALRQAFVEAAQADLGLPPYASPVIPDVAITAGGLTLSTARQTQALQPFGQANPEPLFVSHRLRVIGKRRLGDEHFKLELEGGAEAIAFRLGHLADQVGDRVDLAFHLQENCFRGHSRAQLKVVDLRHPHL